LQCQQYPIPEKKHVRLHHHYLIDLYILQSIRSQSQSTNQLNPMAVLQALIILVASVELFASDFRAPSPPSAVSADYYASYVQHKWDATGISHIGSGSIYASVAQRRLRMDVLYQGSFASSMFDYSKQNADGSVPNHVYVRSNLRCFIDRHSLDTR
jgi:hypothetical protein